MGGSGEHSDGDIAIIGMAGRFPGAPDVDALWRRVAAGDDCLVDLEIDELIANGVPADVARSPDYVRRAGVLDDVAGFDAGFFGIGARDAAVMDPQHRHFLECAWEALESAAIIPERFDGSIGVFGGCGMNTYLVNNLLTNPAVLDQLGWFLLRHTGNDKDFFVNNVAHRLDLRGPAVNIQTACSTSLVAVHFAVQSLLNFECDLALAGGATIDVPHRQGYRYHEGEILASDGRCRAFDAKSGGTVITSGVGVVALRRLADALADGDPVAAVVKGTAINNDGGRKVGFLAPSVDGHADVVREALTVAGLSARDIQLVEAHGTGTAVGDPIEIVALTEAFRTWTADTGFCRITSTKPNVGHLDTAAGIASLIKVVQALGHHTLPPLANHTAPNPLIDFDASPFLISGAAAEWPSTAPRRAGISSLGVGGTNAHVIVEEAPTIHAQPVPAPEQLLSLSARTPEALHAATVRMADHLAADPDIDLGAVAHTLASGRRAMSHRLVVTATDAAAGVDLLRRSDRQRTQRAQVPDEPVRLGFMFPGGGSQFAGMAAGLDERFKAFHTIRRDGIDLLRDLGGPDLASMLGSGDDTDAMRRPTGALPAVFLTSVALARQWMEYGAEPDVLVGHSLGEYVAAHIAGVLSFDDALSLVVTRSQLMEAASGDDSAMLAVPLSAARLAELLPESLSLATINADDECVVAGRSGAVTEFARTLERLGSAGTLVPLAAAAHSALLDPVLPEFLDAVRAVTLHPPEVAYTSNLTGTWITAEQATDPQYWVDHLRGTVRFAECLRTAIGRGQVVLSELGPGHSLSSFARRATPGAIAVIPTLRHPKHDIDDTAFALQAFGRQWAAGANVDLSLVTAGERRLRLPTYPFQHQHHWIEPGSSSLAAARRPAATVDSSHVVPPVRIDDLDQACWLVPWRPADTPTPVAASGRWIVIGDHGDPLVGDVIEHLHRRGLDAVECHDADGLDVATELSGAVVVAPTGVGDFDGARRRWLQDATRAAIALGGTTAPTRFVALTRGALPAGGAATRPADAMALGAVLVAPHEYDNLTARLIDIEASTTEIDVTAIVGDVLGDGPAIVAHRGSRRFAPTLERTPMPAPPSGLSFATGGTYLVTGALGGVGHSLATHLATEYGATLVVVASSSVPAGEARSHWLAHHAFDDPTSRRIRQLAALEAVGAKVECVVADLADPVSIRGALDAAERRVGRIDGAIHAAGRLRDRLIEIAEPDDHYAVIAAKAGGALVLADELERRGADLLVLVSSTSTLLAPEGQTSYVAANAVLDSLAGPRGTLRIVTMNFGLWAGVGAASEAARRQRLGIEDGEPVVHPVFSERSQQQDGTTNFVGRLDAAHHWVIDEHRTVDGYGVLPGTAHLYLLLSAGALAHHQGVELVDVSLLQPLVVVDDKPVTVRVSVTVGERPHLRIESDAGSGARWTLHTEADLQPISPEELGDDPRDVYDGLHVGIDDLLGRLHRNMRLGRRWQAVVSARRGDRCAAARLALADAFIDETEDWSAHPALVDVATAVGVSLAPTTAEMPLYVPAAYDRVRVFDRVPPRIVVSATLAHGTSGEHLRVDLCAVGLDGQAVFDITGLHLRPLIDHRRLRLPGMDDAAELATPGGSLVELADDYGLRDQEGAALVERLVASDHHRLIGSTIPIDDLLVRFAAPVAEPPTDATPASEASSLDAAVAGIWTEVLGISDIGPDDDFFDLGGHSLIAIRLMAKIHREFGVRLPLATIFEDPTVTSLVARLRATNPELDARFAAVARARDSAAALPAGGDGSGRVEMTSHLVPISTSGTGRAFYIVHGAGGNVLFLSTLARAMAGERPIYGFQAHGIHAGDTPDTSVEAMAARYVAELRAQAPGPYLLGGYSSGGLIAAEMARQLRALRQAVDRVVLFDSPSSGHISARWWSRKRHLIRHLLGDGVAPVEPYLETVVLAWMRRLLPGRSERPVDRGPHEQPLDDLGDGAHEFVDLFNHISSVIGQYRPATYDVDAVLLKADLVWPRLPDDYGWGRHITGDLEVRTVPGDHLTMFHPDHVRRIADILVPIFAAHDRD